MSVPRLKSLSLGTLVGGPQQTNLTSFDSLGSLKQLDDHKVEKSLFSIVRDEYNFNSSLIVLLVLGFKNEKSSCSMVKAWRVTDVFKSANSFFKLNNIFGELLD